MMQVNTAGRYLDWLEQERITLLGKLEQAIASKTHLQATVGRQADQMALLEAALEAATTPRRTRFNLSAWDRLRRQARNWMFGI